MKIQIKSWWNENVLFEGEFEDIKSAVEAAIKAEANLTEANLTGADLTRADLTGANLTETNLTGANLWNCIIKTGFYNFKRK